MNNDKKDSLDRQQEQVNSTIFKKHEFLLVPLKVEFFKFSLWVWALNSLQLLNRLM